MTTLAEVMDQLDPAQQAQLLVQLERMGLDERDPLLPVLAAIGYHQLLMEKIPQRIEDSAHQVQHRIENAINTATLNASFEASEATKQEFAEFAKQAIAIAVERSQKYAHNPDAQQARNQGYRWIVATALASLILGFSLGWLTHGSFGRTQSSQASASATTAVIHLGHWV